MIYRREIDGLRTIAVGSVVLFHAGVPGFAGGFAGVDVFFVISGYLITVILLKDLEAGRFSIVKFYERRARRILPALSLVVAVTTAVAVGGLMLPDQLTTYFRSVVATALFAANFYFWRSIDYFSPSAEENPLLHMWSLAVEEQFYIVFPIFLALAWRYGRRSIGAVMALTAIASLGLAHYYAPIHAEAAFYFPVTRAWELLAGAMIAMTLRGGEPAKGALATAMSLLGLALVLVSIVIVDESLPYPSLWTVPPVLGTALLIRYARPDDPAGWLLALAPMVFIGQLSYSIYLWHQPLFAFARISSFEPPSLTTFLLLSALTVPLSWLSWRFVEQPFRGREVSRRSIFALSGVSIAVMVAAGLWVGTSPETAWRLSRLTEADRPAFEVIERTREGDAFKAPAANLATLPAGECVFRVDRITPALDQRLTDCAAAHGPGVLVLGDSHANGLYAMLREGSSAPFLAALNQGGCIPYQGLTGGPLRHACPSPQEIQALVARHAEDLGLALYTQAFHIMHEDGETLRGEAGFHPEFADDVAAYLAGIARHVPVLMLGPQGILGGDIRRLAPDRDLAAQLAESYDPSLDRVREQAEAAFSAAMERAGVPYLSKFELMAQDLPAEGLVDGELTYRDATHLSWFGSKVFGARLVRGLAAQGYGDLLPPRDAVPGEGAADAGSGSAAGEVIR